MKKNKIFNIKYFTEKKSQGIKDVSGFTLVELIIVITILAILSTIAFISFQGYTKNARDSNRLSTLKTIETGLNLYSAKNNIYPNVDDSVEIQGSGGLTVIGYQGYIGDLVSNIINLGEIPKDPVDDSKYLYAINTSKNKYQLLTFMEGNDYNLALLGIGQTYADYSLRYPKTQGNNLGIILDSNNNPISENIDIENYSGSALKVILSDSYRVEGTGSVLSSLKSSYTNGIMWSMIDKNCPIPDIVVGDQIWAGCNSTLGKGLEWGQIDDNIGTKSYSGIVSTCYKNHDNSNTSVGNCLVGSIEMLSNSNPLNWFSEFNSYGDKTFDTIWGKFYTYNNIETSCPDGWHVPTDDEFTQLENYLNGSICRTGIGLQCEKLGWRSDGANSRKLANYLKIPLSGFRLGDSNYNNRGSAGYLWVSTDRLYRIFIGNSTSIGKYQYGANNGLNVRCIKD